MIFKIFSFINFINSDKGGISYKNNFTLPSECSTVLIYFKMVLEADRSNLTLLTIQNIPTDLSPTPQGLAWTLMFSSPYQNIFYETLYHPHTCIQQYISAVLVIKLKFHDVLKIKMWRLYM